MLLHCGIVCAAFACSTSQAGTSSDDVLFVIRDGHETTGSRFGPLAQFQRRLAGAAQRCGAPVGKEDVFADGVLGKGTLKVLRGLTQCTEYGGLPRGSLSQGLITEHTWRVVAPGLPVPDSGQRARMLSFRHEGTDYTDVEFNEGTADKGILTWGPQGATAGQAFQVQRILRRISTQLPDLVDQAFGTEATALRALAKTNTECAAREAIASVTSDTARRSAWKHGFRKLGERPEVRQIYDNLMNVSDASGAPEAVEDFFRSYWAHCWRPTEVDFAFFLDRAVQMDVRQPKTDMAMNAVARVENRAGRMFSPAERRRAVAVNFTAGNPHFVADRLRRDVVYYVDGIPRADMTDESLLALHERTVAPYIGLSNEYDGWMLRTGGVMASDYGLSDARPSAVPPKIAAREAKEKARCSAASTPKRVDRL